MNERKTSLSWNGCLNIWKQLIMWESSTSMQVPRVSKILWDFHTANNRIIWELSQWIVWEVNVNLNSILISLGAPHTYEANVVVVTMWHPVVTLYPSPRSHWCCQQCPHIYTHKLHYPRIFTVSLWQLTGRFEVTLNNWEICLLISLVLGLDTNIGQQSQCDKGMRQKSEN